MLVKAPIQPPTDFKMGRIDQIHPGFDDVGRVATVRTVEGVIKRPVVNWQYCPLMMNHFPVFRPKFLINKLYMSDDFFFKIII